jgi:glycosyltransferase involved in cell wall biosynthesis
MNILAVHSYYRRRGGEDISFETDVTLLREAGHRVSTLTAANNDLARIGPARRAAAGIWNGGRGRDARLAIDSLKPDIVLVNNIFPGLSSSVLAATAAAGVPTLMFVRNYRLACIAGTLYRAGGDCETCLSPAARPIAVARKCYRGGTGESAVALAALGATRRQLGSANLYFAPVSRHVGGFLETTGVPMERIFVKPNTVLPAPPPALGPGHSAVYAGRLEPEKGVVEAIEAFRRARRPGERMLVIGDGSLREAVTAMAGDGVDVIRQLPYGAALARIAAARTTVLPSLWHEPFGRVAIESLARGTPVVAADRGGLAEIPEHGVSGLVVEPTSPSSLSAAIDETLHGRHWAGPGRHQARARFERMFSPGVVTRRFEEIFAAMTGAPGTAGTAGKAEKIGTAGKAGTASQAEPPGPRPRAEPAF